MEKNEMPEPDASDSLQTEIDAAEQAGDIGLANELYLRQIGSQELAPGYEPPLPAPVVQDEDEGKGEVEPPESVGPLTVATDAADETATITTEMDFTGNSDHVAHALEQMMWWDRDEDGNANDDRVEKLKAEWGSDMGANLDFFQAFALAHPDINEILTANGLGDHPVIIRVGAMLGRRYATAPGDPGQITTRKGSTKMDTTMAANVEAQIAALETEMDQAEVEGDHYKRQAAFEKQSALYRLLPGASDPIVGGSGRTL